MSPVPTRRDVPAATLRVLWAGSPLTQTGRVRLTRDSAIMMMAIRYGAAVGLHVEAVQRPDLFDANLAARAESRRFAALQRLVRGATS